MDSALPPLVQAASAAVGSLVGNAIVFPLDLATTRMQHARHDSRKLSFISTLYRMTRRRSLKKLYAGLTASSISTVLSSFIYFYLYSALHKLANRRNRVRATASPAGIGGITTEKLGARKEHGALQELIIGLVAGVASKGVLLPVSAVCVRQQLSTEDDEQPSLSIKESLTALYREEGLIGLWAALPPSIPLALLPSLTLYIHSLLLRIFVPVRHRAHPPGAMTFVLAATSNALATLPLYPMILAKALSQSGAFKRGQGNLLSAVHQIVARDGIGGLYLGLEGQLAEGILQQGVTMLLKQRVEEGVVRASRAVGY